MNPNFLDFEQPIAELEVKIEELQLVGSDNDLNIGEEIAKLRDKSRKLTEKIYSGLTAWDNAHLIALLDISQESDGTWYLTVYNQRAYDNRDSRDTLVGDADDGIM